MRLCPSLLVFKTVEAKFLNSFFPGVKSPRPDYWIKDNQQQEIGRTTVVSVKPDTDVFKLLQQHLANDYCKDETIGTCKLHLRGLWELQNADRCDKCAVPAVSSYQLIGVGRRIFSAKGTTEAAWLRHWCCRDTCQALSGDTHPPYRLETYLGHRDALAKQIRDAGAQDKVLKTVSEEGKWLMDTFPAAKVNQNDSQNDESHHPIYSKHPDPHLRRDVNEIYTWHGTPAQNIVPIIETGMRNGGRAALGIGMHQGCTTCNDLMVRVVRYHQHATKR